MITTRDEGLVAWQRGLGIRLSEEFLPTACLSLRVFSLPMQAGAFKIGDTAGTLDNIIACKLHRPGSIGFVSKSGGMR
jgi:hypothetical protein